MWTCVTINSFQLVVNILKNFKNFCLDVNLFSSCFVWWGTVKSFVRAITLISNTLMDTEHANVRSCENGSHLC